MYVKQLFLAVLIIFLSSCSTKKSLFNGNDLSGWKQYGTEKWYVEDQQIICESGPNKQYGYLGTEKNYKYFQ